MQTNVPVDKLIYNAIKMYVDEIATTCIEEAKLKLEKDVRRKVADVCVAVTEKMSFESVGQEIIVKLYIPKDK